MHFFHNPSCFAAGKSGGTVPLPSVYGAPRSRPVIMAQPIDIPDRAARLARTIASDISLYNEEKIIRGIQNDTLFNDLHDELEEGRDLYRTRVSADLYASTNYFDRAVVDIIMRAKAHVPSKIW